MSEYCSFLNGVTWYRPRVGSFLSAFKDIELRATSKVCPQHLACVTNMDKNLNQNEKDYLGLRPLPLGSRTMRRSWYYRFRLFLLWIKEKTQSQGINFLFKQRKQICFLDVVDLLAFSGSNYKMEEMHDAYITTVKKRIADKSLQGCIEIDPAPNNTRVASPHRLAKNICITIKDLDVSVPIDELNRFVDLDNLVMLSQASDCIQQEFMNYYFRIELHFRLCKFQASNQEEANQPAIAFQLGDEGILSFTQNYFHNITVSISFPEKTWHNILFTRNILDDGNIAFSNRVGRRKKLDIKQKIETESAFFGYDFLDWKIYSGIFLENNVLDAIQLSDSLRTYFHGANRLTWISVDGDPDIVGDPIITWNPYQKIPFNNGRYLIAQYAAKKLFLKLRNKAQIDRDNFQEIVLNKEIARLDHQILSSEGSWKSLPDRIIYCWSRFVSNYGSSWIHPLACLLFLNTITLIIGTMLDCQKGCRLCEWDNLRILFDLFIPFDSVIVVFGLDENHQNRLGFSALNVFHKALYAALLYEIIKSFRRFARRETN